MQAIPFTDTGACTQCTYLFTLDTPPGHSSPRIFSLEQTINADPTGESLPHIPAGVLGSLAEKEHTVQVSSDLVSECCTRKKERKSAVVDVDVDAGEEVLTSVPLILASFRS